MINIQNIVDKECFKWCLDTYILQMLTHQELKKLMNILKDLILKAFFCKKLRYSQNRRQKVLLA